MQAIAALKISIISITTLIKDKNNNNDDNDNLGENLYWRNNYLKTVVFFSSFLSIKYFDVLLFLSLSFVFCCFFLKIAFTIKIPYLMVYKTLLFPLLKYLKNIPSFLYVKLRYLVS